ncbi:MAG: DUF6515 family protein [Bacteroidota bacterium]
MKKALVKQALMLPVLLIALLFAQGQRSDRGGGRDRQYRGNDRGNGNPGVSNRSFNNNNERRDNSFRRPNAPSVLRTNPGISRRDNTPNTNWPGNNISRNRNGYDRSPNIYRGNRSYTPQRRSAFGYRRPNIAPRFTIGAPYFGQRFNRISHPFITIGFGGFNYNYYGGAFYRPFGGYYQVVRPPRGIRISILPAGYHRFDWSGNPYYYYNGIFYNQNYSNNYYEVVDPPLGAKLPDLPAGAKRILINGQPYFENDGTYYAEEYNENNEVLYTVVGVDGVLNEDQVSRLQPYESDYLIEQ